MCLCDLKGDWLTNAGDEQCVCVCVCERLESAFVVGKIHAR